jgi:intracellular sulfur oxidation DsrE/DsrF family protein
LADHPQRRSHETIRRSDIEIVAYGPGIGMLKADSKVAGRLAQVLDNNIGLMACENTMRNNKIESLRAAPRNTSGGTT